MIKPKILSDEKLAETFNKLYGRIIYSAKSIMPSDRAIAEAQNDYCYKEMLGQIEEAKKQEAEAIIRCIKDAKRVHPDWAVDDVIELLQFREETRQALRLEEG